MDFCNYLNGDMSATRLSLALTDKKSVSGTLLASLTDFLSDRQKVCPRLKKLEENGLKISTADRLFVCQWLQKTKKKDEKMQNSLFDRQKVCQLLDFPWPFAYTDRQKVCQSITFGPVTDFLSVSGMQKTKA